MVRIAVALIWLALAIGVAAAQSGTNLFEKSSRPTVGGVGVPVPVDPPTFGASAGTEILRHRGPTGTPCLTVGGLARPHVANPNVYDHVIAAKNSCAQRITMQVCYYKSQDCVSMDIPGGERKEAILGTLPAASDFRFEFREKF
jgi:hypothetical protein